MRNLTTFVDSKEIEIYHATAISCGYGHKEITVELSYNGAYKKFTAITNNMPDFDKANDFEGSEKYYALYTLIERQILDNVSEWLETL